MAEGAAFVLLEIIEVLAQSTLGTMVDLLGLSDRLLSSLSFVSTGGGLLGIGVALAVIAVVGLLLAKFFLGSVKTLMKLAFVAIMLLAMILLGYSFL
jgi:hypothetical protein